MEIAYQDWADLFFRWFHVIAGIAWIGSSFYFIWLDLSLRQSKNMAPGVYGDNWSVHGGGFYHSQKYLIAPEKMPPDLKWFKYEAYSTWLSGFFLMAIIYYWGAETFLIDDRKFALSQRQAISISFGFLLFSWVVYDLLCKSPICKNPNILVLCVFSLIVASSFGLSKIFSDRAALLHVGAMIGSMMVGNVFFIIIPNQKKIVADLIKGVDPDPRLGQEAKTRSTHNNYLTLPTIFMMISTHYPILGNPNRLWIVVGLVLLIGGIIRHFFNCYHASKLERNVKWQLPVAVALALVLIIVTSYTPAPPTTEKVALSPAKVMRIINKRCVTCHSNTPTDNIFSHPPAGIILERISDVKKFRNQIISQSVNSQAMPPGNKTKMTLEERRVLGDWLKAENKN